MSARRELGFCFVDASPGYVSGEQRDGELNELWPDFESDTLVFSFLNAVADSWNTSISELLSNTEMTHRSGDIYGFLNRALATSK